MYHERRCRHAQSRRQAPKRRITFRNVLAFENFVLLIVVVFGCSSSIEASARCCRSIVAELGTPIDAMPMLSGVLFSISAGAGAIGNHLCARPAVADARRAR